MKTITVFCANLYAAQVKPEKFMAQIKEWEAQGYRLNFQLQDDAGLTFMQSLVTAQQDKVASSTFPGLFLLGISSAVISIMVGWMMLVR
jgi:hypothetical protein